MRKSLKIDRFFLVSVILLTVAGFLVFNSASLGLLARDGATFQSVALNQTISLVVGAVAFFLMSRIQYNYLQKSAFYIFLLAVILNLLLFVPSLTLSHAGASRWVDLGFITFQPSEFLKLGFVIYFAAWLSKAREKVAEFRTGPLPFLVIMAILGTLLLLEPDTDTLVVIGGTGMVMLYAAGARLRHLAVIFGLMLLLLTSVALARPYVYERIMTFFNHGSDTAGAGYQIQQSLIAIGAGGFSGRGFGQSVQKFNYLPEPIGDSIFAVGAEEFGFIGSMSLVALFLIFILRSFKIGSRAPDVFGGLAAIGIAILIGIESFMNIASMLGIIPLSGMPLLFVSHGGTALIIVLAAAGIIANISKYQKTA